MYWDGGGPGWWIVFPIVMPIVMLIIGLIWLVFFREIFWGGQGWRGGRRYGGQGSDDSAVEILRRRLASGEITSEEYQERLKLLKP